LCFTAYKICLQQVSRIMEHACDNLESVKKPARAFGAVKGC
jgi:hypothetical protein